jgi:cytochrome c-type biogenesis protein CcmH
MRIFICSLFFLIVFISNTIFAADNNYSYQFNLHNQQIQFERITHELRCFVCQNETLANSSAALAKDLRQKIAVQIMAGASDKQILNFLINRYGDFILY